MATKHKGKNLSLLVDGEEFKADGTSVVIDNEDADDDGLTFADLDNGDPKDWFIQLNAISDYASGSFWSMLWDNAGQDLAWVLKPYGNTTPSPAQPHFRGIATVAAKPPIGGEAGETWTYEARLNCLEEPERVTAV